MCKWNIMHFLHATPVLECWYDSFLGLLRYNNSIVARSVICTNSPCHSIGSIQWSYIEHVKLGSDLSFSENDKLEEKKPSIFPLGKYTNNAMNILHCCLYYQLRTLV